jgi:hypothetical protein
VGIVGCVDMPDCARWNYPYLCGQAHWGSCGDPELDRCECQTIHVQKAHPGFDTCGRWGVCISVNVHGETGHCDVNDSLCETSCYCKRYTDPAGDYQFWPGVSASEAWFEHAILRPLLEGNCRKSACCYTDPFTCQTDCYMEYQYACEELGGEHHLGRNCDYFSCGVEACCFCGYKCNDLAPEECKRLGGKNPRHGALCGEPEGSCDYHDRSQGCRQEPFSLAECRPHDDIPVEDQCQPGTWQIASLRGLRMMARDPDPKQYYGRLGRSRSFYTGMSGWVCSNWAQRPADWRDNEANKCFVVVQTEDDILSTPLIPPGCATFVCSMRCGCQIAPCVN